MKRFVFLILALVFVAELHAQMLTYSDSTGGMTGYSTNGVMRAVASTSAFKTYWWGPFDVSDCWVVRNVPSVATDADTVVFRSYLTGMVDYVAGDTVLGRWKAYVSDYPYAPQTRDGASTTWAFNWNNADSLASYKIRQACDFVSTKRDGYPMHSRYAIQTVASDTVAYTNLYVVLELDSTTGSPAATEPLDFEAFWSFHCSKK